MLEAAGFDKQVSVIGAATIAGGWGRLYTLCVHTGGLIAAQLHCGTTRMQIIHSAKVRDSASVSCSARVVGPCTIAWPGMH